MICTLLLGGSTSAAQSGKVVTGAWFDGGGAEVSLSSKTFNYERLSPGPRDIGAVVQLFQDACVHAAVGVDAARPAIQARSDWAFRFLDVDAGVPLSVRLDGWQTMDVSITSQVRAWPLAECNVLAARSDIPDLVSVTSSLTAILGAEPDKHYQARSADGRKLDGRTVRWSVAGPNRQARRVYASAYTDINGAHALHLGLTESRPK